MTTYFKNLCPRSKLIIVAFSIFILSLSVGLLLLGDDFALHRDLRNLSTDILHQGKEALPYFTP